MFYATTGNMRPVLTSGWPLAPMASESQSFPSFLCSSHRFTPRPSVIQTASIHRLLFIPHKVLMFSSCYYFPVCLAVSIPPTHLHPSFSFLLHIYSSCCPCSLLQMNTSVCSHPSFSIFFFFPPLLLCCPIPPVLHGFHIFKVK